MEKVLAEIKPEKKKILTDILVRSIWLIITGSSGIFYSCIFYKSVNKKAEIIVMVILILLLIFALFPLIHLKDVLVFYDSKIVLNNKQIAFNNPGEIVWKREIIYIMATRIKIYNSVAAQKETFIQCMFSSKDIDVTYMKEAKETFIKCYLNQ